MQLVHYFVAIRVPPFAQAVGSRAAGVEQGYLMFGTQFPEAFAVFEIEPVENFGILFGGIGAGTEVKHGFDLSGDLCEPVGENAAFDTLCELFAFEISIFDSA